MRVIGDEAGQADNKQTNHPNPANVVKALPDVQDRRPGYRFVFFARLAARKRDGSSRTHNAAPCLAPL